ncbi:hypothetical protein SPFM1_00054 [Salmonella phage SPFM1]|nr:hypothetical protein SPFM1_00054 [Salmonella phage SPFM1]
MQIGFFFNRHGIVFIMKLASKSYPLLRERVSSFFTLFQAILLTLMTKKSFGTTGWKLSDLS